MPLGMQVSLQKPDRAKPKGRTIKESEARTLKLGARGEKKMTRKCKNCGIADGHNIRTCLAIEENRIKLANMDGRKRGRPRGSKNKLQSTVVNTRLQYACDEDSEGSYTSSDASSDECDDDAEMKMVLRSRKKQSVEK